MLKLRFEGSFFTISFLFHPYRKQSEGTALSAAEVLHRIIRSNNSLKYCNEVS